MKNLHALSDEALMHEFTRTRAHDFFETLYTRYADSVFSYVLWLSGDANTAKEVSQEVFIKIYHKSEHFDDKKVFKAWLITVVKNTWKNTVRTSSNYKARLARFQTLQIPENSWEPDTDPRLERVHAAMPQLSEEHREIIVLKYSQNLTIPEIAEVLQLSAGTVKSRLFYAIQKLRKITANESE